jgi:hypothetical protein
MKQIRLPKCKFDIRFLLNSIKRYRHFQIQILISYISIGNPAAISTIFRYPRYASKLRSSEFIHYPERKHHPLSLHSFSPSTISTIASSHSSNLLSIDLFHFSSHVYASVFTITITISTFSHCRLYDYFSSGSTPSFFRKIRIVMKFHRDRNPSCSFLENYSISPLDLLRRAPSVRLPNQTSSYLLAPRRDATRG